MDGKKPRSLYNTDDFDFDFVVDRISDLPDSILVHILSNLPTDDAVATSILSKRWKFSWVSVHSLHFSDRKNENEQAMEFVRFVNRVLLLNDPGFLNKFSLNCHCLSISRPHVVSWINTAITRYVHELKLSVGDIDMPASLFSCDSLRSLDLNGIISIYGTSVVSLPRLVSLKIDCVRFESEVDCEKLISGCPNLHYLNLKILRFYDVITCMISSASLRRLDICFVNRSKLKLKASSLEYLKLSGCICEIFVEKSLNTLVQAELDIWFGNVFPTNSIVEAVRAFDSATFLTLSTDVLQALSCATISLLTEFKRLVKLVANTYCCALLDIIQNSENLEDLTIYTNSIDPCTSTWTAPVEVPRCLSKSLKRVRLQGYKCLEVAHEMIRYMLENGSALEVVEIVSSIKGDGKNSLVQEIREFSTKSPDCQVQFCVLPSKRDFIQPQ